MQCLDCRITTSAVELCKLHAGTEDLVSMAHEILNIYNGQEQWWWAKLRTVLQNMGEA